MATYEFTRWIGRKETVVADKVTFETGGALIFENFQGRLDGALAGLVLAVQAGDWNNVRQVN